MNNQATREQHVMLETSGGIGLEIRRTGIKIPCFSAKSDWKKNSDWNSKVYASAKLQGATACIDPGNRGPILSLLAFPEVPKSAAE
jgi:hypothetical protein